MGYDIYGVNPKMNKNYPERYNEIMKEWNHGNNEIMK